MPDLGAPDRIGPDRIGPDRIGPDTGGGDLAGEELADGDPFGTAALRTALLATWSDSPTRFREDANAEEDLVLGGYAETWFVELAQNAADAARAAGVPGRMRLGVHDGELRVANTGAPLDAAGVTALASLRASAKRDDPGAAGRFGVGFAAVLPISDAPRLVTGPGTGVRFSAAATAAAVCALPGPAAELTRRGGHVPVLRLVWPCEPDESGPPPGHATEVRLPVRPGLDPAELLERARAAAPDLLLALPDLAEVVVAAPDGEPTVVRRTEVDGITTVGERHYRVIRAAVATDPGAAVEERHRRERGVCWALPVDVRGDPAPLGPDSGEVLHAPTAAVERLGLPARLIADLPLDPDRRRVRTGPVADAVLAAAAAAFLDLVRAVAPERRLDLVPAPGFPLSELDGRLRAAVVAALAEGAWLPGAAREAEDLVPRRAEWLDVPGAPDLPALLAAADPAFARLAAVEPRHAAALGELGVRRIGAAGLVERLHGVDRDPGWWRSLYAALEPAVETVPGLTEELRALPVPLLDGRLVAGPPGVLLPGTGSDTVPDTGTRAVAELALPGLHVADPGAVHPLLERLGATATDPAALLDDPALREAVERSLDDAEAGLDTAPLAEAVLGLLAVTAAPGFGALALPDADGRPSRADELMLPDAAVRKLFDPEAPVGVIDPTWTARIPREALVAAGVLDGFAVVVDEDPAGPDHDLHDEDLWWDEGAGPTRLAGVRDLDLVADDAWSAALALLAARPETRAAVLEPGGYTGWWLARHALLGGYEPGHWRLPDAERLAGLYDPVPVGLDERLLAAIGVRAELAVGSTEEAADLLERLADPARTVDAALAADAHAVLAAAVAEGVVEVDDLDLPDRVRSLAGTVVSVDDAVVLDAPWTAAVLPARDVVVGGEPHALADILDLPLASDVVAAEVVGTGRPVRWSALPEVVVACRTAGLPVPAGELWVHEALEVDLTRPEAGRRSVPTWVDTAGRVHAADPARALLALSRRTGDDGDHPGLVLGRSM
ncbi:sacsin N-terminal ATP-binding-like domain-containing protein [Pseudonocardia sp. RS010]|uniref:sacsin N-terminal ATP-binding-like domain-containing protein n=1 Tax=Pseudonocardia sp. RS010 TaxID=3385979 RepID=UPI00399FEA1F